MERAGFVGVALYGNLDEDEYGPKAERLIAVGRKPISKGPRRAPVAMRFARAFTAVACRKPSAEKKRAQPGMRLATAG